MQQRFGRMTVVRHRFQWGSYGFVAGIVLGIILGWLFHGVVGWIFRFGLVALLLVPLVALFLVWRRLTNRGRQDEEIARAPSVRDDRDEAIEARSFVVETRTSQVEREER